MDNIIKFKSDTAFRKRFFVPKSFSHPAKMSAPLLVWIVEHFTSEGETILDVMFGSGTTMLACTLGRNVIGVELEQKFVDMAKANWEVVKMHPQLGSSMGTCQILQGDARNLEGLLCDKIITSPPFASEQTTSGDKHTKTYDKKYGYATNYDQDGNIANLPYGDIDKCIFSPPYAEQIHKGSGEWSQSPDGKMVGVPQGADYTESDNNISNLPYGNIDTVVTSPPYEEAMGEKHHSPKADKLMAEKHSPGTYTDKVDSIVTSPPYEGSLTGEALPSDKTVERFKKGVASGTVASREGKAIAKRGNTPHSCFVIDQGYSKSNDNIGNLKSTSYLEAMLAVYQQCHAVLKSQGLMILVTKNFIRNQKEIRLDLDTIKLCEQSGFTFKERWYRELTSQSFWRVIYRKKYPNAPELKFEDVLIFSKGEA